MKRRRRRKEPPPTCWEVILTDDRKFRVMAMSGTHAVDIVARANRGEQSVEEFRYEFEPTIERIPPGLRIRIGDVTRTVSEWCRLTATETILP